MKSTTKGKKMNNNSFYDNISGYDITINNDGDICLIIKGKKVKLCDSQKILNEMNKRDES